MAKTRAIDENFLLQLYDNHRLSYPVLPPLSNVGDFAGRCLAVLFPHYRQAAPQSLAELDTEIRLLELEIETILKPLQLRGEASAEDVKHEFTAQLPAIFQALMLDARAIFSNDPAAESLDEVMMSYPGFYTIAIHRIANQFYRLGVPIFPRMLAEIAHQRTGIDIHPGAKIGASFFVDHGTGIVVGETTVIADNVKLYQGVTLGAHSVDKVLSNTKRHPTIESNVTIYANATILGGDTVIGHDSVIGGNVWLTSSVPPNSLVYHTSEVKVKTKKEEINAG